MAETLRSERLNSDALGYFLCAVAVSTKGDDNRPIRYAANLAGLASNAILQLSRAGLKLNAINLPGFALIVLRCDANTRET